MFSSITAVRKTSHLGLYRLNLRLFPGIVASRGSLIVADALVIAVTWWKLFRQASVRKAFLMRRHVTLSDVFLRDGKRVMSIGKWGTI